MGEKVVQHFPKVYMDQMGHKIWTQWHILVIMYATNVVDKTIPITY